MPASSPTAPARQSLNQTARAPQHLQALAEANRVRRARAALKRCVASGDRCAREVILECPWESESMALSELLSAQRRWGLTRTRRFLMPLEISENKAIGTLTARQRMLLASGLEAKGATAATDTRAIDEFVVAPAAA
jgi:hypothetical protein